MTSIEKLFLDIKTIVKEWCEQNEAYFKSNKISSEVVCNEKDCFVVIFDNNIAMAEVVVEQANHTPYRFVSFEVATVEFGKVKISYSWYDDENTSKKEIKEQLSKGINYFINI